jgi:hypothetical protein
MTMMMMMILMVMVTATATATVTVIMTWSRNVYVHNMPQRIERIERIESMMKMNNQSRPSESSIYQVRRLHPSVTELDTQSHAVQFTGRASVWSLRWLLNVLSVAAVASLAAATQVLKACNAGLTLGPHCI